MAVDEHVDQVGCDQVFASPCVILLRVGLELRNLGRPALDVAVKVDWQSWDYD